MKRISALIIISLIVILMISMLLPKKEYAEQTSQTSDIQLLARAINGEARGESYEGQVAVGAVILNRVKHSSFPNTIAGVIYEPGAFTAVADGQINHPIAEDSTVFKCIILILILQQINGFGQRLL